MAAIGFELDTGLIDEASKFFHGNLPPQRICISKPALGELTMKLAEAEDPDRGRGYETAMQTLREYVQEGKLSVSWARDYPQGIDTVRRHVRALRNLDTRLDSADALIIACAMADDDVTVLYSTDDFINNIPLQEYTSEKADLTLRGLL